MNEHRISLDLSKEPLVAPVLYLGQGDKLGTTLIVSIYDDGQVPTFESGSTVTLCMKNPGENGGYYEVAGTLEGNVATFTIDEEYAASTSGVSDIAYVEVSTSFNTTSTSRFTYVVFPSAEHGADPSSTYSNGINEAIERANDAAEAAEGVVLQDVPLMSPTVRGGAQLGDGLAVSDGVLSVDSSALVTQAEKGAANGVASLDPSGLVPSGQLPSYVDDVIEGYYYNGAFYEESTLQTLITGETGKIYVDLTADSSYRWSGNAYISISNPIDIATEAEARAGSDNTKMMTPLRVKQVVTGDIAPSSVTTGDVDAEDVTADSVTSSGEVTATETSGGTTSLHKLTEKADLAVVESRSKCWYGECTTAASTAAKTVTCAGFELVEGAMIAVHFSNTNTADEATMNVNSTGAKRIATGNTISGQDNFWYAGDTVMFTYDGTYWRPANMGGINALRESVGQLIKTTYNEKTLTLAPNGGGSFSMAMNVPSGYKILSIASWRSSAWEVSTTAATFEQSTVSCYAYNSSSSSQTTTIGISVLLIKE